MQITQSTTKITITKQNKTAFEIMERDHTTGESVAIDTIAAINPAEAKSKWHIRTGQYDTAEFSYWVKYPVCR